MSFRTPRPILGSSLICRIDRGDQNELNVGTESAEFCRNRQRERDFFCAKIYKAIFRQPFENMVRKRENADKQHFLLFTQYFLTYRQ